MRIAILEARADRPAWYRGSSLSKGTAFEDISEFAGECRGFLMALTTRMLWDTALEVLPVVLECEKRVKSDLLQVDGVVIVSEPVSKGVAGCEAG
jgi:hypothetical protein